ncbi:MAG: DNA-processing protein DprA [Gemmatimonadota bacterium]
MDALISPGAVAGVALALAHPSGGRALGRALRERGSAEAVARRGGEGVAPVGAATLREARALLTRLDGSGTGVLAYGAPGWPARLSDLHDPPPVLFVRGRTALLERPAVAFVGARNASEYGLRHAERLAARVARAGVTVISGLALGIDGAAHGGALATEASTIAVLGAGLDVDYPRRHRILRERIAAEGLIVTEFVPGTPPLAHHFPRRNRIVAALASAVVVVEAGKGSGSLITVDHALDLGRAVYAVPGPIDSARSAACNQLLREGAHVVVGGEGFLEDLGLLIPCAVSTPGPARAPGEGPARAVWEALGRGIDPNALVAHTRLDAGLVARALTELELQGFVTRTAGDRYVRVED